MQAYDESNIFAKILRGEIPCTKVYEDDAVLAFMDIMPQVEGHVLVIAKAPSRTLLDTDPAVLAAVMPRVQTVGRAVVKALAADGLTLMQFSEAAGGQTVFHLHFHLMPRRDGVPLRPHEGPMADPKALERVAARIRAELT
ncbi:HIT family protein [Lichenibacterium ramalinae]|uniref:HIT family protein n=1 Tax=Lichenibacterium ramalinae TaxID=2316527 RepID=A0A4Q2R6H4_9HYPH|nr:HIT family protein [Lichenibacterium ramalinae]RYB02167.1 HIT family protein [Lichenibacterium ramalinae]